MELILNLAWGLLAAYLLTLWWKQRRQKAACSCCVWIMDARTQLIALCVILVLLFPIISVSDDLLATQFPAETNNSIRKCHATCCSSHTFVASHASEAVALFQPPHSQQSALVLPELHGHASANSAACFEIDSRPPPAAL